MSAAAETGKLIESFESFEITPRDGDKPSRILREARRRPPLLRKSRKVPMTSAACLLSLSDDR